MTHAAKTSPSASQSTSFAKTANPAPEPFKSAPSVKTDFAQAKSPQRGSSMVKQDQPKPVQRPSPALAMGPDGTAFNARWEVERKTALADQSRAERKAAFLKTRSQQSQTLPQSRSR